MSNEALPTPHELQAYLARIGYSGNPKPDFDTLIALTRLHMEAFPYENFDVQLGRRLTRDPRAAFVKMVEHGRGGWCYEFNGLFVWMLEAVGFHVLHLAGAVMREAGGDKMIGNHLVPIVELDRLYLADPSMGIFEPVPLAEGPIALGFRRYALEQAPHGWWRFRNHPGALPPSFDFSLEVAEPAILDAACEWLQADSGSPFVRHAILQRHSLDRMESLVGRTHTVISADGECVEELASREAYERAARERFGLVLPDATALWTRVSQAPATGFLAGMGEAA